MIEEYVDPYAIKDSQEESRVHGSGRVNGLQSPFVFQGMLVDCSITNVVFYILKDF